MEAAGVLARPKPWQTTFSLGMALFLVSEAFLFGSLFWTYYYLRGNVLPVWPPQGVHLNVAMAALNTAILLASSGALHWAVTAIRRGGRGGLVAGLVVTLLLGSTFLGITIWEWTHASFRPSDHAYGSIFFTLTGFHAAHVLGGLLLLASLLVRTLRGRFSPERHLALEVGALYWHFVDLVWLAVFTSIFIVK